MLDNYPDYRSIVNMEMADTRLQQDFLIYEK